MARFDHAVIYVADLAAAVRDYTALGFTVFPGSAHEGGPTWNALVPFADGSYLELIAFRRRRSRVLLAVLARLGLLRHMVRAPLARRFALRAGRGPGLIDVVVAGEAIPAIVEAGRRAGVAIDGPVAGRRAAADGAPIAWELGVPRDGALPLFIADITPRERRTGASPQIHHANGVSGVAGVVLPASDPGLAAGRLRAVLGLSAASSVDAVELGATRVTFTVPPGMAPDRPIRLSLASTTRKRLDVGAAHGAVLDLG
jgi:hypothetical protein